MQTGRAAPVVSYESCLYPSREAVHKDGPVYNPGEENKRLPSVPLSVLAPVCQVLDQLQRAQNRDSTFQ